MIGSVSEWQRLGEELLEANPGSYARVLGRPRSTFLSFIAW